MLRDVLRKSLRDQRRSLLFWSVGLVVLAAYVMAVFPSVRSQGAALNKLMDTLPEALRAGIGGQVDYASATGYLHTEVFFIMLPVLVLCFGIAAGSRAVAGEEERGTLDLLLSLPLPRRRLVVDKLGAMVVALLGLMLLFWVVLLVGTRAAGVDVTPGGLLVATLSAAMLGVLFGCVALLVGCATGRRGVAIGVSAALGLASYLLNSLGSSVAALQPYRKLSPFYWYIDNRPLLNGFDALHVATMLGVAALLVAAAVWALQRRDVGV
jgi:ABC-2 type transport system permease protein